MAKIQTIHSFVCDVQQGAQEVNLQKGIMHQDAMADVFRVEVMQGGQRVDLTGVSVHGYLYVAQTRQTLPLAGSVEGNAASVVLTSACYDVPGYASLCVQLHAADVRHTLLKVNFCIVRTGSDLIVDPDSVLPSLAQLLAQIAAMEQATAEAQGVLDQMQGITDTDPDMVDLTGVHIVGGYISADGTISENENLCYTEDYVPIEQGWKTLITNRKIKLTDGADFLLTIGTVKFYKEDKSLISATGDKIGDLAVYEIPLEAAYARFNLGLLSPVKYVRVLKHNAMRYLRHAQDGENVDDFTQTGSYLVGASANAQNTPFDKGDGGLVHVVADPYGNVNQFAFNREFDVQSRIRSSSVGWSAWRRAGSDKIGEYSGSFTELNQSLDTGIRLNKNTRYLIRKTPAAAEHFTTYIKGNTNVSRRFWKWSDEAYFTPATTGNLVLYNYTTSGFTYTGEIGIEVIVADQAQEVEAAPHVYTVGKTAAVYDYTSLTQCLLDLKDDNSPKTIYINEGDYDIYQEYKDAGVPAYTGDDPTYDYIDYCVWIPKNTHIIGRGLVRLMWMPDPETGVTYNESATVSPVNCAGSMTLENVEIHCKNGRYCIHDDPKGDAAFTNAIKKYVNVRCYKYANDDGLGWRPVIGFGVDRSMRYEFHNCIFKHYGDGRAFYMHTRNTVGGVALTEAMSSNLIVSNCVMDTNGAQCVKLGNSSHNCHIRVDFNSCWFSGYIDLINESSTAESTYHNAWDLKLLNCNEVDINIADPENMYPPMVYGK